METVVLLVDDEPALLTLVAAGLEQHGFRVLKAQTAAEAVDRAKQLGRIDVLATDIILCNLFQSPEGEWTTMHGIDLARRLTALFPALKVILFSGHTNEAIAALGGIPVGATFLRKPFDVPALVHGIEKVLGKAVSPPPRR